MERVDDVYMTLVLNASTQARKQDDSPVAAVGDDKPREEVIFVEKGSFWKMRRGSGGRGLCGTSSLSTKRYTRGQQGYAVSTVGFGAYHPGLDRDFCPDVTKQHMGLAHGSNCEMGRIEA